MLSSSDSVMHEKFLNESSILAARIRSIFGLVLSSALGVWVIAGNVLTLLCLALDRQLRRNRTNAFVGSLAIADLALGLLVLPLATAAQWLEAWPFGGLACRIWLVVDVWLYTASIYNLIVLAIDRYFAITRPLRHRSLITGARSIAMIAWAWTFSFCVALPAVFFETSSYSQIKCSLVLYDTNYIVYASMGSFYLPMILLLYLYLQIYYTVRRVKLNGVNGVLKTMDVREAGELVRSGMSSHVTPAFRQISIDRCLRIHRGCYRRPASRKHISPPSTPVSPYFNKNGQLDEVSLIRLKKTSNREKIYETVSQMLAKKRMAVRNCKKKLFIEFRAVRTVAMVTACFFLCWSGFCFVCTATVIAQQFQWNAANCTGSVIDSMPGWLIDCLTWMGYVNSAIDPLIYAGSNRRFRRAFRRILRLETVWCLC